MKERREMTTTGTVRCHSRTQAMQKTMNDRLIRWSSIHTGLTYLIEEFTLNSSERVVLRKGKGRQPDPRFRRGRWNEEIQEMLSREHGRKVERIDLNVLSGHFEKYVEIVNDVLSRVYSDKELLERLGEELVEKAGHGYVVLKRNSALAYKDNEAIREKTYERLYRNALEQAARIVQSDWMRRQLLIAGLEVLNNDQDLLRRLLGNKYIPRQLIQLMKDTLKKKNGNSYYYALSAAQQLRKRLDHELLGSRGEPLGWRTSQRRRVSKYVREDPSSFSLARDTIRGWLKNGYPFETPLMLSAVCDFSASTENMPGQGYWFSLDRDRENEVLFHLKLPRPIRGREHKSSPYRVQTLTLRFLDWLVRAAQRDERKARDAAMHGKKGRARQLRFRAAKMRDQHMQLVNTIELQHAVYRLTRLKSRKGDPEEIERLKTRVARLRLARRSAPPRIIMRGERVVLQIPFLPPHRELIAKTIGEREYHRRAGADRGVRVPLVVSVSTGKDRYVDEIIEMTGLLERREALRQETRWLSGEVARKKRNWESKTETKKMGTSEYRQQYPGPLLKKMRHLAAVWRKIRRLDREIARQVASRAVWWCEEHEVRTLVFESLKNYTPPAGRRGLSWALSTNLWARIWETIVYMRQQLGHKYGGVWSVNPKWTSQTCSACGERGYRIEWPGAREERRGGEYFYCP
ncbi:MAG: hypothetical protein ACTSXS_06415, partial [Candidatus Thorarchaeota archaeon]